MTDKGRKMGKKHKRPKECLGRTGASSCFQFVWVSLLITIVANVVAGIIIDVVRHEWSDLTASAALLVLIFVVLALAAIMVLTCLFCHFVRPQLTFFAFVLVFLISVTCGHVVYMWRSPEVWNFENGTTQGWGVYDSNGNVELSADLTASSENTVGKYSMKVTNLDLPEAAGTREKLLAVNYDGDLLFNSTVATSVYVPADATLRYGDVKFFLFDKDWTWRESGVRVGDAHLGVGLKPGKWIKVYWNLDSDEAKSWTRPWKGILGIKVYIEEKDGADFAWPIYIDDVTITVSK